MMATYIAKANIEAKFGVDSVTEWATLENASPAVAAATRIANAITYAEGYFNMRMAHGPYAVPVSSGDAGDMAVIADVVATFAGKYLYEGRGRIRDADEERMSRQVTAAEAVIDGLLNNRMRLQSGGVATEPQPTAPMGVC